MKLPSPNSETVREQRMQSSVAGQAASRVARSPATASDSADPADPVEAILAAIRRGRRFLVCSHARPDGDAVGSMLACGMLLKQMGKQADLVSADHVPMIYRSLPGVGGIRSAADIAGDYDAVLLLECDGLERTGVRGLEKFFLINVDHHLSGRDFANLNWIDCQAPSVGEMIYRLVRAAGGDLTPEMATCLYTTVLTDTGGFCYGSINTSTFELARELVRAGADPVRIAQEVCFSTPASKMLLLGAALNNLKRDGRVAWLWVTHEDMIRTCAVEEDCEGIVNFAIGIRDVQAAAFLRELPEGRIRMSLRSKGKLNLARIAERLGGGGHQNAAGCTVDGPLTRATDEIVAILRTAVANLQV